MRRRIVQSGLGESNGNLASNHTVVIIQGRQLIEVDWLMPSPSLIRVVHTVAFKQIVLLSCTGYRADREVLNVTMVTVIFLGNPLPRIVIFFHATTFLLRSKPPERAARRRFTFRFFPPNFRFAAILCKNLLE